MKIIYIIVFVIAILANTINIIVILKKKHNTSLLQKESKDELQNTDIFNNLEEDLLSSRSMGELYEKAGNWLFSKFSLTYVAFSFININNKLSIEYYKETTLSESNLIEAVSERIFENLNSDFKLHDNNTFSIPFSRKGKVIGYIFIGFITEILKITESEIKKIRPFIRIFNTSCIVSELAKTKEQRSSLQKAFSSYVPSAIVNSFEHDPSVLKIGGDYEKLTIMFTDLQGFTALSQTMNPSHLVTVLNEYFSEMSGVIERFGGTVSKLAGDGILAFFKKSDTKGHHAERCCEAAIIMKKYEQILNNKLIENGNLKEPLFTRIGINTGEVILGNIGSEKRLDYTIIGPEVNLASRIEQANKKLNTQILISHATYLKVKDSFDCKPIAYARLKGFKEAVQLYELIDKVDITEPIYTYTEDFSEIEMAESINELNDYENLEEI